VEPVIILGILLFGITAGILGALFGIGGGIIIVPALVIVYGLSPAEAAAISLVAIVATSVGAASFYVRERVSNIRLGLLLEISTTIGAISGAILAIFIGGEWLMLLFACVVIYSGARMIVHKEHDIVTVPPEDADFTYRDMKDDTEHGYEIKNVGVGSAGCALAGMISSMTGLGGGAIKVPLMNIHMNVPIKAATATSSYMIGITAFSGAVTYFIGGMVLLEYAAVMALGSYLGAAIGSRLSAFVRSDDLKKYVSILFFTMAAMILLRAGGML
jgi:uncharacterized membrane protein YfcA